MDRHQDGSVYRMAKQATDTVAGSGRGASLPAARMFNAARNEISRAPQPNIVTEEATVGDYFALLKPRVMSLVVFTGFVGMMMAPGQINPVIGFIALLCIAVGAGASGALNMWYDADIDAQMERTKTRPIPMGRVAPAEALNLGVTLSLGSILLIGIAVNATTAALLALTIGFYMFIYTMWLKRRTPQNIVIGGAAGAFPPMIGWAAVTGTVSIESIVLFMIIFMWTPPHFWALALFMNEDYSKAGVPMLTVTHGKKVTRNHILVYTIALVPFALATAFTSIGGPVYLAVSLLLNAEFLRGAYRIWKRDEAQAEADKYKVEKAVFRFSLLYLFLHFSALLVEAVLRANGMGGW